MTEMEDNQSLAVERGPAGVFIVHGDVDVAGGPILEEALLHDENNGHITIDLGDVSFIDSSGLRCLLAASRRAHDCGATVVLRHVGNEARRLLQITGTTGQFSIEDDHG